MAHSLTQPTTTTGTKLQVLSSGGAVLDEVDLVTPSREGWARNTDTYQALGSSEAVARGDGRVVLGVRTAQVLVRVAGSESIYRRLYQFEQALASATYLRWGDVTLELVGLASITNPNVSAGERDATVTIRYAPRYAQALEPGSTPVLGPL